MNVCIACGMPLENEKDIGTKIDQGSVCIHCINTDGHVKNCDEIFAGGVQFFVNSIPGTSKELAERVTRKNMNILPYWQTNKCECLEGEEVSEEEFATVLAELQNKYESK